MTWKEADCCKFTIEVGCIYNNREYEVTVMSDDCSNIMVQNSGIIEIITNAETLCEYWDADIEMSSIVYCFARFTRCVGLCLSVNFPALQMSSLLC